MHDSRRVEASGTGLAPSLGGIPSQRRHGGIENVTEEAHREDAETEDRGNEQPVVSDPAFRQGGTVQDAGRLAVEASREVLAR